MVPTTTARDGETATTRLGGAASASPAGTTTDVPPSRGTPGPARVAAIGVTLVAGPQVAGSAVGGQTGGGAPTLVATDEAGSTTVRHGDETTMTAATAAIAERTHPVTAAAIGTVGTPVGGAGTAPVATQGGTIGLVGTGTTARAAIAATIDPSAGRPGTSATDGAPRTTTAVPSGATIAPTSATSVVTAPQTVVHAPLAQTAATTARERAATAVATSSADPGTAAPAGIGGTTVRVPVRPADEAARAATGPVQPTVAARSGHRGKSAAASVPPATTVVTGAAATTAGSIVRARKSVPTTENVPLVDPTVTGRPRRATADIATTRFASSSHRCPTT